MFLNNRRECLCSVIDACVWNAYVVAVCCSVLQCVAGVCECVMCKGFRLPQVVGHFFTKEPLIIGLFCGK